MKFFVGRKKILSEEEIDFMKKFLFRANKIYQRKKFLVKGRNFLSQEAISVIERNVLSEEDFYNQMEKFIVTG